MQIKSADEMQRLGHQIGAMLRGGEVFELIGDVGAGKTTFVHGLARGMGITESIQSPSFTINRQYEAPNGIRLMHYDFYRLEDAGIMSNELSEALGDEKTVVVIEWADAVADILTMDRLILRIVADEEFSRQVIVESTGERSQLIMKGLHDTTT